MEATSQGSTPESWMQRARSTGAVAHVAPAAAGAASVPGTRGEVSGWDPFDVWLHRINRPRQTVARVRSGIAEVVDHLDHEQQAGRAQRRDTEADGN